MEGAKAPSILIIRDEGGNDNDYSDKMTVAEAAALWGKSVVTVRQACTGYKKAAPRFRENEARQSGATWLVTRDGMTRVFGPEKNS